MAKFPRKLAKIPQIHGFFRAVAETHAQVQSLAAQAGRARWIFVQFQRFDRLQRVFRALELPNREETRAFVGILYGVEELFVEGEALDGSFHWDLREF